MISLKNVVLLSALSLCVNAPAFAKSQTAVEPTTQAAVLDIDIANSVFEQKAKVGQVAKLSNIEMKETEGAFWGALFSGARAFLVLPLLVQGWVLPLIMG